MQQHSGRPQGECPSHWPGENAIHQLPATLSTTSPLEGKLPAQKTYETGLFCANENVELLVLFSIMMHI